MECDIYPLDIDELDEIDGDEQLALAFCSTHGNYEWHWVPRKLLTRSPLQEDGIPDGTPN